MLNCHNATQLMSESQDRPLTRRERWGLAFHTAMCGACRRFQSQVAVLGGLSRQFLDADVPTKSDTPDVSDSPHGSSPPGQ
ncbi:zf-HC2 domain-containing protein [Luminiphilus syltensis]|uniref:zf-HC2 domain-containing protein n=1 Tax=Luminiphilus syltensis TaxID=1341119 RepID=UPI0003069527|nr:zf-HC2 domain-containing protein [Luminiphilus syltensis]